MAFFFLLLLTERAPKKTSNNNVPSFSALSLAIPTENNTAECCMILNYAVRVLVFLAQYSG